VWRKPAQRRRHHFVVEYERAGHHDNQHDERHDHDELDHHKPDDHDGAPSHDHHRAFHDDDGRHRPATAHGC
jgi:hypothetical protein